MPWLGGRRRRGEEGKVSGQPTGIRVLPIPLGCLSQHYSLLMLLPALL